MRKALCVGIDSYKTANDLHGCVNDANGVKAALERNGDGTLNFNVKLMCATSEASYITRAELKDAIQELFRNESEIMQGMAHMMPSAATCVPVRLNVQMRGYP